MAEPYDRRSSVALLFLVVLVFTPSIPSLCAQKKMKAGPMPAPVNEPVEWEKYLVQGEPHPTLKIPVAHQHTTTGCLGYLYMTRDEIWYDVVVPTGDRDHAFRFPRSSLTDARQWRFMRSEMPEVEFKFSGGKTYHFFRVRQGLIDDPAAASGKFGWNDVVSWEPLAQAATSFDEVVRMAVERQRAQTPSPAPAVSLTVSPSSVEKGQPVTLTWVSANAASLDLEPGIGPVPASGSKSVVPVDSTTYTLTAQGPGGSNSASGHVAVNGPSVPLTIFLLNPSAATPGQTLDVNSSSLEIRGIVMGSSGLPVVTINGVPAILRPKSPQAAEFTSDPMVLKPGENRFEIAARDTVHSEAKFVFTARFTPAPSPQPSPASPANAKGLTKADILQLLKGSVPSARVANLVRERGIKFAPNDDDFKEIRAAGGDDELVDALMRAATPAKQ